MYGQAAIGCPVERSSTACPRQGMPHADASDAMARRGSARPSITIPAEKPSPGGS